MTEQRPAHLASLEAEGIHILREVAAQAARPVLLYSIGKDSSVLLHLARKAFFPARSTRQNQSIRPRRRLYTDHENRRAEAGADRRQLRHRHRGRPAR